MTRINSAIPVECLTDEHLLAEHREIKRLPYSLQKAIQSGSVNRIPKTFTLGKGHVLFFLDKQGFSQRRYNCIHNECKKRKFFVEDYNENFNQVPNQYRLEYTPNISEHHLLVERISRRISESTKDSWHYYGRPITKEQAIKLLTNELFK